MIRETSNLACAYVRTQRDRCKNISKYKKKVKSKMKMTTTTATSSSCTPPHAIKSIVVCFFSVRRMLRFFTSLTIFDIPTSCQCIGVNTQYIIESCCVFAALCKCASLHTCFGYMLNNSKNIQKIRKLFVVIYANADTFYVQEEWTTIIKYINKYGYDIKCKKKQRKGKVVTPTASYIPATKNV